MPAIKCDALDCVSNKDSVCTKDKITLELSFEEYVSWDVVCTDFDSPQKDAYFERELKEVKARLCQLT